MNNATLLISKLQTVGRLSYSGYTQEEIMVLECGTILDFY